MTSLPEHIAVAEARVDQLIEQQRAMYTDPCFGDMPREEILACLITVMMDNRPPDDEAVASLIGVSILAIDRLARLPRPEPPPIGD